MKLNLKKIKQNIWKTLLSFPVEILLAVCIYGCAVLLSKNESLDLGDLNRKIFSLPLALILAFVFNHLFPKGKLRYLYYAVVLLGISCLFFNYYKFLGESGYFVAWIISLFALLACKQHKDNSLFTISSIHLLLDLSFAIIISGGFYAACSAIYFSTISIFHLPTTYTKDYFIYVGLFSGIILLLFSFLFFQHNRENEIWKPIRVFDILINFILSPGIVIYTAILYIYIFKILFSWELPEGMISYMVFAFVLCGIIVKASQVLVKKQLYKWYFNYFSWIVIPPIVMFWIGALYRISEYGFTEMRVYMLVCGAILTLTVLSFLIKKLSHYLYLCIMATILFAIFTYIPYITAKEFGLRAQEARIDSSIEKLNLRSKETGLLEKVAQDKDSLNKKDYRQLYQSFEYVAEIRDSNYMFKKYGFKTTDSLTESIIPKILQEYAEYTYITEIRGKSDFQYLYRNNYNLDISAYSKMYSISRYSYNCNEDCEYYYSYDDSTLNVINKKTKKIIVSINTNLFLEKHPLLKDKNLNEKQKDNLLIYKDDNYLIPFSSIELTNHSISNISISYIFIK